MRRLWILALMPSMLVGGNSSVSATDDHQSPAACVPVSVYVPQLMYHMIEIPPADAPYKDLWVNPLVFRNTMKYLHDYGWRTLTSKQVAWRVKNCQSIAPKTFTITIDDGNRNGYDNAFPILQEFGFKATFAVIVKRIDVYKSSLTWSMLTELQAAGQEIANHSMSHVDLRDEDTEGLIYEIEVANQTLYQHLGVLPRTFVYPFGYWDNDVVRQVVASKFWSALTTVYGCTYSVGDRFTEERIRVHRTDTPSRVYYNIAHC